MQTFVKTQRVMARQQFPVQLFIVILIAALASVASSVCHNHGNETSDFEVQCSKNLNSFNVKMICHSNDWTRRAHVKINLSYDTEIQFENCTFPSKVKVLNILHSMKLSVIKKVQIKNLRWMFHRKILEGLSVSDFHLTDSDFQEVPSDLMYDVVDVRSFQISDTQLVDISDSFFGDWAKNLTQVNLRHNNLQKIKKNYFSQLVDLTTLNLDNNKITEIESAAFDKLVNLKTINLSSNRFRTLPAGVFQHTISLNLAHNQIEEINPAAFNLLVNLESINLSSNRLRTLPVGVFQRNIRLKSINLGSNWFDELPQDLLANSKLLEEFFMDANNGTLSTLPDMFFKNLGVLKDVSLQSDKLKSLPSNLFNGCSKIIGIYLNNNQLTTLPSGLFDDTRELEVLKIRNNSLETLPPHIFIKLKRLYSLDLSTNRLTSLMAEVLDGLQSVNRLDASDNNITRIDDRFFHYLKSAEAIILSNNQITFDGHQHVAESQDKNASSLINTSENKYVPLVEYGLNLKRRLFLDQNNITEFNDKIIKLLKYVDHINLRNNRISHINLSGLSGEDILRNTTIDGKLFTEYVEINLGWNPFHCDYDIKGFIDQLKGRNGTELKEMIYGWGFGYKCASPPELRGRELETISADELSYSLNTSDPMDACTDSCVCRKYPVKQIFVVDCSYRNLTNIPPIVATDFGNWSIELNMTGNNLQNTPSLSDPSLTDVISLDLSNNNISQVSVDLFSPKLQQLKLHGNSISQLDSEVLDFLASHNSLHSISLHDNKWICDCGARHLLNFMQTESRGYLFHGTQCHGTTQWLSQFSSFDLCSKLVSIIVGVILIIAMVVAYLIRLYCKYKPKIKVWLYSKQCCLWCVTEKELDEDKQYDAFISFSSKDEDFVEKEIVAKLESGPRPYKLCLHNREWFAGGRYPVQINRSVAESRRTIIVITPDYLDSVWGQIEFKTAHFKALKDNQSRVIIIIYGDIGNIDELGPDIRYYLLYNSCCIKWGDPWFWDKLRYALPHGMESVKYKSRNTDEQCQSVQLPLTNNVADAALKNDATPKSNAPANESINLLSPTSLED